MKIKISLPMVPLVIINFVIILPILSMFYDGKSLLIGSTLLLIGVIIMFNTKGGKAVIIEQGNTYRKDQINKFITAIHTKYPLLKLHTEYRFEDGKIIIYYDNLEYRNNTEFQDYAVDMTIRYLDSTSKFIYKFKE